MEYSCTVRRKSQLTANVFEIALEPDRPLVFQPGQYVSVVVPPAEQGKKELRRPYSIASAPENPLIELCVQKIEQGPGSTYLDCLQLGDRVRWFAPYGHLVYHARAEREAMFIATGTGIAPFRSILLSDAYRAAPPMRCRVLMGVRREADLLYERDFKDRPGVEWIPCLSQPERQVPDYFPGRVTSFLQKNAGEIAWAQTEFYVCGNGAMVDEVRHWLREKGVEKASIHQEIYFRPSP